MRARRHPAAGAGRRPQREFQQGRDRIMLSEIRKRVVETGVFGERDMIPLPCNPESDLDRLWLAQRRTVLPLTSLIRTRTLLAVMPNTISPRNTRRCSEILRPVLAVVGPRHQRARGRIAVLPADLRGARRPRLRKRVPRHHRAIPRSLQFLRRQRQTFLHPFRDAEGRDHPVRHLQPVLPQRQIDDIRARMARQLPGLNERRDQR